MEALIAVLLIYICIYGGFIIELIIGYNRIKSYKAKSSSAETSFSIIIPFRDEQMNLHDFLESIALLDYPRDKFELIFVDDNSADFSVNVINKWRMANGLIQTTLIENLRLSKSPKKDAITRAMPIIENKWIITTDADCIVKPKWLQTFNSYILEHDVEMLAGSVIYDGENNFVNHFQRMDMLSLQGATIGSFGLEKAFMCNGANFAYTKSLFLEIDGFEGNSDVASGDDVFLLQKAVAKKPKQVHYLKADDAIVRSKPMHSWLQLLHQRVRWASKTNYYQSEFGSDLALVVLLANFALVFSCGLCVFNILSWKFILVLFVAKAVPDMILLIRANQYLRRGKFFVPILSSIIYPFFCVLVVLFAIFGKYKWKGRSFKI